MRFCISSFFKYFNDTYIVFLNQSQTSNAHCHICGRLQILFLACVINAFQLPLLSLVPFHSPHIHTGSQAWSLSLSHLSSHTHLCKFILNSETRFPMGNFLHEKILMSFLFLATLSKNVIGIFHLLSLTPKPRLSHLHFSSLNIQIEMKKAGSVLYIDFIRLRQVIICMFHMPDYVFCAFLKRGSKNKNILLYQLAISSYYVTQSLVVEIIS